MLAIRRTTAIAAMLLVASAGLALAQTFPSEHGDIAVETVADGLDHPWGLDFLPDGTMLVTERSGTIRHVTPDGAVSEPLAGAPETREWGQGGMLDIAVAPDFDETGEVYVAYATIEDGLAGTAIWRGLFIRDFNPRFEQGRTIFRMQPLTSARHHFGARIVFDERGQHLWFTIGDRGDRPRAQDGQDHAGSVLRIDRAGYPPADNPGVEGSRDWLPEIWSIGHRNAQGAARHPETGLLWTISHGARGGDEINIPEKGKNYGWPTISYGRHYSGGRIGVGTEAEGLEQPIYYWDPSIAPSGAMFYSGDAFPAWRGNLFVGALRDQRLVRLTLDGETVAGEEHLFVDLRERIRDVVEGPDGLIYLLTDSSNGRILRLSPAR